MPGGKVENHGNPPSRQPIYGFRFDLGDPEYETEVPLSHFQCPKNVHRIKTQLLFKYYYSIPQ